MDFHSLPSAPDHPRYLKRHREIESLLRNRKERLVEEGMLMDRATAEDDLWWFCKRFTSFQTFKVEERGHPLEGRLWVDHPFVFWLCRQYQQVYDVPQDGWVWIKMHRLAMKSTTLLASFLWIHARNPSRTIGLWTHKAEEIGTGMGRGLLAEIQTDRLRDYFPQFRNLKEGTKQGYVVDRPPGPREQSLVIHSILTSTASIHPDIYALDDVVTDKLRGNVEQIAKIRGNISALAALMTPGCPVIVCNTPWDEADPLVQREKDGLFAKVVTQAATTGGDFTPAGEANLHTAKHYARVRKEIDDDSIYVPQFELKFHKPASILFDWNTIVEYEEAPEQIVERSPFVNIIVDGAGGKKKSDFTVIRVITWTAHDRWANLELIRERVGVVKTMQILLGRDPTDPTTGWVERLYCPRGVGLVEKWMKFDRQLAIWFDDGGNAGWIESFHEMVRMRRISFAGGKVPQVRKWPEVHHSREDTKTWRIGRLEGYYGQRKVAYPKRGFGHGSENGLAGGPDKRDTMKQFREDEFERLQLGKLPPFDDMLDTESLLALPVAAAAMRRPSRTGGIHLGGVEFPVATINNPFGIPGGAIINGTMKEGRTWMSM